MKLTGARWSLIGAEAVLRLRALRASDDFDAYWASRKTGIRTQPRGILRGSPRARDCSVCGLLIPVQSSQRPENRQEERRVVRALAPARLPSSPRNCKNLKEPHPVRPGSCEERLLPRPLPRQCSPELHAISEGASWAAYGQSYHKAAGIS
jgi:hypothetical protein